MKHDRIIKLSGIVISKKRTHMEVLLDSGKTVEMVGSGMEKVGDRTDDLRLISERFEYCIEGRKRAKIIYKVADDGMIKEREIRCFVSRFGKYYPSEIKKCKQALMNLENLGAFEEIDGIKRMLIKKAIEAIKCRARYAKEIKK